MGGAWTGLTTTATVLELTSTGSAITFASANNPTASYTVTYTPSGGTAANDVGHDRDAYRGRRSPYADHRSSSWRDGQYRGVWRQPDPPESADPTYCGLHNADDGSRRRVGGAELNVTGSGQLRLVRQDRPDSGGLAASGWCIGDVHCSDSQHPPQRARVHHDHYGSPKRTRRLLE